MPRETLTGYSKSDLVAAHKLLTIHIAKLSKSIDADNFAEACSAIRAVRDECDHASRIAMTLSLKNRNNSFNNGTPRIGHGANTGAL